MDGPKTGWKPESTVIWIKELVFIQPLMIVRPFADTNLAVYGLDADPARRAKALSVMRARPVISVQVVNEFLSVVICKGRLPRETVVRLARILMNRWLYLKMCFIGFGLEPTMNMND